MDLLFINIPILVLFVLIFFVKNIKTKEIIINFSISFIINLLIALFFKLKFIDAMIIGFYNVINIILIYYKKKKWTNFIPLLIVIIEMFALNFNYIFKEDFNFNYSNFILLNLFVIFLMLLFKDKEISFEKININKIQKITLLVSIFLTIVFIIYTLFDKERFYIKYPLDYDSFNYKKNPYALLFEGFLNKHLYLNIKPDPRIGLLPNPYVGFTKYDYLWDFA